MYKKDNILENVMAEIMMEHGDGHVDGYREIAKEAKEIAIEFGHYLVIERGRTDGNPFIKNKSTEELFNKFIEEKYG